MKEYYGKCSENSENDILLVNVKIPLTNLERESDQVFCFSDESRMDVCRVVRWVRRHPHPGIFHRQKWSESGPFLWQALEQVSLVFFVHVRSQAYLFTMQYVSIHYVRTCLQLKFSLFRPQTTLTQAELHTIGLCSNSS